MKRRDAPPASPMGCCASRSASKRSRICVRIWLRGWHAARSGDASEHLLPQPPEVLAHLFAPGSLAPAGVVDRVCVLQILQEVLLERRTGGGTEYYGVDLIVEQHAAMI